ncbi:MAG: efflux RND transporter periplasmic adaptor subunit [Mucilaginibacter sp.]|nr:efflux RND transporter periplasmic adaptor subunit [Mucilaginibacter sp.]
MKIITYILCIILSVLILGCNNIHTIHPARKDIVETVYASGKVMADSEYTVYALSPGTVIKKLVKEGDVIKKGQLLYVINNMAPEARLDAANVTYEKARENVSSGSRILSDLKLAMRNADIKYSNDSMQYFRLKNLWNQNIGTKSALDNAEMQYRISFNEKKSAREKYYSTINDLNITLKNAQSSMASARNDLNNYMIRAESNGTVYQMLKERGEAVRANEAVVLIGKSTDRLIRLSVDQQDINLVQPGEQVLLKTDATGDKIYNAKVVRVYPTMNEADQTFRVDAIFTGHDKQPFIHTSVEANIVIQKKQHALVIPVKSILTGDSVKIKDGGKIKAIPVKIGIHTLDEAEILSGLNEQSEVVESSSDK